MGDRERMIEVKHLQQDYAVEMRGISKYFGEVYANQSVDLTIKKGEILALLGENGSGKTTLMNMLAGIYYPDSGQIFVNGKEETIRSPKEAFRLKIGMVHQHFKLVDVFTAAENILLGAGEKGHYDIKKASEEIKGLAARYGFDLDPERKIHDMAVSEKQTVEIIKVLYRGADILILDEPTAVLTPQETEKLFAILRSMRDDGKSIVIITHKLGEVMAISDRVTVLRKGEYIETLKTKETNPSILAERMVGKTIALHIERPQPKELRTRLVLSHVSCRNQEGIHVLDDVSFELRSGEILGVAGIAGSGQRELCEAIAGLYPVQSGSIRYHSPDHPEEPEELVKKSPSAIRDLGVSLAFVPEDRLGMGLIGSMGMVENMLLKSYRRDGHFFMNMGPSKKLAENVRSRLGVVTPDLTTPVRRLSGGNVQKVLLGREIASAPSVLMTAYPVRGLDIHSSYMIYSLLNEQKKQGVAVLYVGEDLDVLLELCDRILVLCGGKVSGIVDGRTTSKEKVGLLMTQVGGVD